MVTASRAHPRATTRRPKTERAQRLQRRLGERKACASPRSRSVTSGLGTGLALRASMLAAALSVPALQSDAGPVVLACEALSKVYRMGEVDVRALDGVDFALHERELVVLVGASGSGKSTL